MAFQRAHILYVGILRTVIGLLQENGFGKDKRGEGCRIGHGGVEVKVKGIISKEKILNNNSMFESKPNKAEVSESKTIYYILHRRGTFSVHSFSFIWKDALYMYNHILTPPTSNLHFATSY